MPNLTPTLLFIVGIVSWAADATALNKPNPLDTPYEIGERPTHNPSSRPITTFSIVAYDPQTGDYGVAVQSKYFAVGDVVPFAKADSGAIATQARGNLLHGPKGLRLVSEGVPAQDVIAQLIEADAMGETRQVGVVDSDGRPATFTGEQCLPWAGGLTGEHYAVQGNLLVGPQVVDAIAAAYEAVSGDLATRLVYGLAAGQAAGGDARGRQSAAVMIVRKKAGYAGLTDRYIDLHVEDHPTPLRELKRLLDIRHAQLAAVDTETILAEANRAPEDQRADLIKQARTAAERGVGFYRGDDHLWWLVARTRLLDDDLAGAVEAGRFALLLSPSWPRLPQPTRVALGLDKELVDALRDDVQFRRLWDSLAATEGAP